MVVIDQIIGMKNQGLQTNQIIENLKQQGISPKEINEALSQSEIKSEISGNPEQNIFPTTPGTPNNPSAQQEIQPVNIQPAMPSGGMQQSLSQPMQVPNESVMTPSAGMQPSMTPGTPVPQNLPPSEPIMAPSADMQPSMTSGTPIPSAESPMPEYQEQQEYPEYQGGEDYYPEYEYQQSTDIDTIRDISSQITDEKTKEFKKEFSQFANYKKETEMQIDSLTKKLDKIEKIMEELQIAIIKKVGEYGEDIKKISGEIKSTQDSFSKVVNPLMDQRPINKTQEPKKTETKKSNSKRKPKNSPTFEDFLR